MPIYEYRCRNGHQFEVIHSMADDPVSACRECEAPVERVFHPVAVHFKGSGFYTTDYARKGAAGGGDSDSKSGDSQVKSGDADSKSGDSQSKSGEAGSKRDSSSKSDSGSKSDPGSKAKSGSGTGSDG